MKCKELDQLLTDDIIINKAIKHYGSKLQIIKCIEELSELQKELCKDLIKDNGFCKQDNIKEEISDVEIMLQSIKLIYNIKDYELIDIKNKKLKRLNKIINDNELSKKEIEEFYKE
jgi:hypothetical protein